MRSSRLRFVACLAGLSLVALATLPHAAAAAPPPAAAASYVVYTGYADCPNLTTCTGNVATNPSFPTPWYGSKGAQFVGTASEANLKDDSDPDESAIRIDNTGKSSVTISEVSVFKCNGGNFDPWGKSPYKHPYVVAAGTNIIFSGVDDDFDGSEGICNPDPKVTVDVNGVSATYTDKIANHGKGAILGGSGTPFGDESTPWTKISSAQVTIDVVPGSLTSGVVGTHYDDVLGAQGSNGAPSYKVLSGSLPPGLSLSPYKVYPADAQVIGKPTKAGTYTFTVRVTDTAKPQDVGTETYKLQVKS